MPISAVSDYERKSGGHIGFYAENIRTGAKLGWRAEERFVMCSTFKASLAACVLAHVDCGKDDLMQPIVYAPADIQQWHAPIAKANLSKGVMTVGEMCAAIVEYSDNTCANILLARIGGPSAMTAFWRGIGDGITRLDDVEPDLNDTPPGSASNTTTPTSMAYILRRLALGDVLSKPSRAKLVKWLIGCQTVERLRTGIPRSWTIGNKTGNNGKDAAGDIAIVWPRPDHPIIISVYTRGGSPTAGQLGKAFKAIGLLVSERLSDRL